MELTGQVTGIPEEITRLQGLVDFYRDAYEKAHKRAEALEKSRDQLFEREANHTEAYGMVCQERDSWKARAEKAEAALEAHRQFCGPNERSGSGPK